MKVRSSLFKSSFLHGVSIALLAFYAWVLWLAFHPVASETYQNHFIHKTNNCWFKDQVPALYVGAQMPFGYEKPGHHCMVLKDGWDITATPWGSWSTQLESTLRLYLESDAHRYATLRFFVLGFDLLGRQDIDVYLGNQHLAQWHPEHEQVSYYDLKFELQKHTTTLELSFLFADPMAMQWLGKTPNNLDHRLLGMGLLGIDWIEPGKSTP